MTRLNKKTSNNNNAYDEYFVFLQKFPLQNTWQMIFHTEVVVCPRNTFTDNSAEFLSSLDKMVGTLSSTVPFVQVPEDQWNKQTNSKCVQLGYGGADCPSVCCGSPHGNENTKYALSSRQAVIGNAMGESKQLFLYGISDGTSGVDAHRALCHGKMAAIIEQGQHSVNNKMLLPTCVSNWAGTDYNPLTNNCNTFTSTVLTCVFGLSDKKPNLGVSDMVNVVCPMEKKDDGMDVQQCLIPTTTSLSGVDEVDMKKEE